MKRESCFQNKSLSAHGNTMDARTSRLVSAGVRPLALEQRFMFDGAAVVDATHAATEAASKTPVPDMPAAVEVRSADPCRDGGKKEVVFVDTSIDGYKTLEAGIRAGVAIVEIDGSKDGLAQIAEWAKNNGNYDAIHILSHGSEGVLNLGSTRLSSASLASDSVQTQLAELGQALKPDGDLLLYGCDIAKGSDGLGFIENLAKATGADVAASNDLTGTASKGGDWVLEQSSGDIEQSVILSAATASDFSGLLADTALDSTKTKTATGSTDIFAVGASTEYTGSGGHNSPDSDFNGADIGHFYTLSGFDTSTDKISVVFWGKTMAEVGITIESSSAGYSDFYDRWVAISYHFEIYATSGYICAAPFLAPDSSTMPIGSVVIGTGDAGAGDTLGTIIFLGEADAIGDIITIFLPGVSPNSLTADNFLIEPRPIFTSAGTASFAENGSGTAYSAAATASNGSVTYSLSGTDAALFDINSSSGAVTFKAVPNYESPGDSGANNVYNITVTATDSNGSTNQSVAISVTDVNEFSPTLGTPTAASYTDTAANNSFSNTTGTLSGSDPDGSATLSYGISGGTTGGSNNIGGTIYDVSKAGTYGTLYVKSSTGAYVYVPNDSAINGLSGNSSENFTLTTSDGSNSANATYTVNLTGTNDTPSLSTPGAASYTDTANNDSFSNTSGSLAGTDRDTGQTLSYGISGGTTGGSTNIGGTVYDVSKAGSYGTLYVESSTGEYVYVPGDSSINALTGNTSETFTVTTSDGAASANAIYTVNLTGANDTPTLATPGSASYTDTGTTNTFSNTTGTLAGNDHDSGASLSYGITGGSTGGSTNIGGIIYDISMVGSYGILYVKSSTGAYVYVPNNAAINGLTSSTSETFTVTTGDGTATTNATYTVNLAGANDTPSNISLSNSAVGQSDGSNATVGTLGTTDADSGQTFTYTLVAGNGSNDSGNASFNISGSSLRANDAASLTPGTYNVYVRTTDSSGATFDKAFTITVSDDIAPSVTSVSVPGNATFGVGDNMDFTVNFDENVTVSTLGGTPSIALTIGGATRYATYLSGSGNSALTFRYTVQSGDLDGDGIAVGSLSANGGSLKDAASNNATLTLNSVGATASVLVDGVAPSTPTVAISADTGTNTGDEVTKTTSQSITVTGEIGTSVDIDFGDGSAHATGMIGAGGTFTTSAHSYTAGQHTISATLTDAGGNASSAGTLDIVVDTSAPAISTSSGHSISTTAAVNGTTVCTLAASDTTSISGFTDALAWTISGGADAGEFSLSGSNLVISNPAGLGLGDYAVEVTATDTAGNTDTLSITVSVVDGPTVTAVSRTYTDTSANDSFANQTGSISASANTGSITGYGISGSSAGSYLSGAYDLSKTGTYGTLYVNSSTGAYAYVPSSNATLNALTATVTDTFTIEASDGGGTAGNTLTITVNGANDAPALSTPTPASYTDTSANDSFANSTGTLAGSDRDTGASFSYGISGGTTGGSNNIGGTVYDVARSGTYGTLYVNSSTGAYVYVPDAAAINTASGSTSESFTVTTSDGSASGSASYTVNLTAANDAPIVTAPGSITATEDVAGAITGISFADVDAGSSNVTATLSVTAGTLSASSGSGVAVGGSGSSILTLSGSITDINAFIAASKVGFTGAANATGAVTLTSSINDCGHSGAGGARTASDTTTINISAVNDAPMAGSIGNQNATETQPFTFTLPAGSFSDPDNGDHLTYAATQANGSPLPAWLTFDPATRTFSGTPNKGDSGSVSLRVTATDGSGLSANTTFTVQVAATVVPPQVPPTVPVTETPNIPPADIPASAPPTDPIVFLGTQSEVGLNAPTTGAMHTISGVPGPSTAGFSPAERSPSGSLPGFHIATAPAGSATALIVNHGMADTQVPTGGRVEISVPADAFAHTDPNATVVLSLRQADGRPLPGWAHFDPLTGKLILNPPPGFEGRLTLRLLARDSQGREAVTTFRLVIGQRPGLDGRSSLHQQLQDATRSNQLPSQLASLASKLIDALRLRA